jgi:hypothetical protein
MYVVWLEVGGVGEVDRDHIYACMDGCFTTCSLLGGSGSKRRFFFIS